MPETCPLRLAPLTARTLPTASICERHSVDATTMVDTVCGGLDKVVKNFRIITPLNASNPKTAPRTSPVRTSMMTMRFSIA